MKKCISESRKLDRKTIERNRRIHMKGLCFKLVSVIPSHRYKTSKELMSQQDQLDEAANYITQLKDRIDELKKKKEKLAAASANRQLDKTSSWGENLPMVEVRDFDSSIAVNVMISRGVNKKKKLMLSDVISILEEEGAQVVTSNISTIGDNIFHTLHAQVKISRVGIETSRVSERLRELIYSTT